MGPYQPKKIEPKWQKVWDQNQTYRADLKSSKPKYFAFGMFNYPSGSGIHIGHSMNYTISDVLSRFKRQQGYESFHPVGWDAFGLPAENYAIKSGVSPQESMRQIIPGYHKQYKAMGWSDDWSREISTHEPDYYRWTQWIFAEMYKNDMAYQASRLQWWCTIDNTVLANEQVTADGKCWRHDGPNDPVVKKREVKQWFFKITDYAEELLAAIPKLDWTDSVKTAQTNWIGKSEGALIKFKIQNSAQTIEVFTTRADTIFGATFLVLAPEHELVDQIVDPKYQSAVKAYQARVAKKSDVQRQQEGKAKTGVFTGCYALNPATGKPIPVWIADYVLPGYGKGAIMAVPAHDQRDYDFAHQYDLPITVVVEPETGQPQPKPEFRRSIVAIVRNPKDGKFLSLNWGKDLGGSLFIGGGVEKGEDIETCAIREIAEETGYQDVKLVAQTENIHHHYFAKSKNVGRQILATGLLFELTSSKRTKPKLEAYEQHKFEVEWLGDNQVSQQVTDPLHSYVFDRLVLNQVWVGEGLLVDSGQFSGQSSVEARPKMIKQFGTASTIYKLLDWSVSRQRYWGAPVPIIHCPKCGPVLVPDSDLPVVLPKLADFLPTGDGRGALARATEWVKVSCPNCKGPAERDTDTLDTYLDSAWYFFRYLDPKNTKVIFDSKVANHWMPVDFYNGADHATAHMIYARFITRFFYKQGLVDNPEPFKKFLFNGKVVDSNGNMFSKSKGNAPDPLDIINDGYGADALRLYLMFAAPLDQWIRWDPKGVPGTYRFITRVWNLVKEFTATHPDHKDNPDILKLTHPVIDKVTQDIEHQKYNTAIAAIMELTNKLYLANTEPNFNGSKSWQFGLETVVQLMAPFAPHVAEELWQKLGHQDSIHIGHWPKLDKSYLEQSTVTIVIQVDGKLRSTLVSHRQASEAELTKLAKVDPLVKKHLSSKKVTKTVYVPGRLINFVTT